MKNEGKIQLKLYNVVYQKWLKINLNFNHPNSQLAKQAWLNDGKFIDFKILRNLTKKANSWIMILTPENSSNNSKRHIRLITDIENEADLMNEFTNFFDQIFEQIYHFFQNIVDLKTVKKSMIKEEVIRKMKRKM
jgi:hypothetical protein